MAEVLPDLAIVSRRIVAPSEIDGAILVKDGKVLRIDPRSEIPEGVPIEDYGDLIVMPGLVDLHVHCNEPGRTEWEGFETATKAAAAGGITTIIDMPLNSSPVTTSVESLRQKIDSTQGKLFVDVGFHGGLVPGNADQIEPLIDAGVAGIKAFLCHSGIDEFPNATEKELREAMPILARRGVPLLVHAELVSGAYPPPGRSYATYVQSRPPEWEQRAIELVGRLAAETGCAVHIVHVASTNAIFAIRQLRKSCDIHGEACPHYLYFNAEEIPDGDTSYKCAPPIRNAIHQEALWEALGDGTLLTIGSDHSPCPPDMKHFGSGDFEAAWGGIASLQLSLPVVAAVMRRHRFFLPGFLVQWLSSRPASTIGLSHRKGYIATGRDADLVVFDPDESFTVRGQDLFHRHKLTPYEGHTLKGKVKATYLRGRKIYDGQNIISPPTGQTILRKSI